VLGCLGGESRARKRKIDHGFEALPRHHERRYAVFLGSCRSTTCRGTAAPSGGVADEYRLATALEQSL
jgi:hypothetical protein